MRAMPQLPMPQLSRLPMAKLPPRPVGIAVS
jgi:hypothetical protein